MKALASSVPLWQVIAGALAIGIVLLAFRRTRRLGKLWLGTITGAFIIFGIPVVALAIAGSLPTSTRLHRPGDPIDTLVIFDGDNRRGRLAVALQAIATRRPARVWVLSDEWLADELAAAGRERSTFGHDTTTTNTRDQMAWIRRFLAENPEARVTAVVSRLQAARVAALAETDAMPLTILAGPIDDEPASRGWRRWLPSYVGLRASRDPCTSMPRSATTATRAGSTENKVCRLTPFSRLS